MSKATPRPWVHSGSKIYWEAFRIVSCDTQQCVGNKEQDLIDQANAEKHRKGKLLGARYKKSTGRYESYIMVNKKYVYLGYFDTEKEANNAYNKKAKELGL